MNAFDVVYVRNSSMSDVKYCVKEWIKLYPTSFNQSVSFALYELENNTIAVVLDECLSSLAVSLLVMYFTYSLRDAKVIINAFITLDDKEILPKIYLGKRVRLFIEKPKEEFSYICLLTEDNKLFKYSFDSKAKEAVVSEMLFEEPEVVLTDNKVVVLVGDVLPEKKVEEPKIDGFLSGKLIWYLLFGVVGLILGFALVYVFF